MAADQLAWPINRVRETFVNFFVEKKQHLNVISSSVVPHEDPTLLFTNAGMNQFKPLFLGQVDPKAPQASWKRAANSQKCIRAGGKHNDLDDVGKDVYHHTFFEMLGNWSFGDYFKREAIDWAWELLTEVYGLDKERIYVTYFKGNETEGIPADEEARQIWLEKLPEARVLPFGMKENFWEMGDTGPCGPCSEIHFDKIGNRDAASLVNADDPTVIEIWNLVFMQFNRASDSKLTPLPAKSVDTGMGLERITAILQSVPSNYDINLFSAIFARIREATQTEVPPYSGKVGETDIGKVDMAYRVIADHIRTLTFAINDGAIPSNVGRGYVLRRILRRAVRYGRRNLGAKSLFLSKLVGVVVEQMASAFPELNRDVSFIENVIREEEESFLKTLDRGERKFKKAVEKLPAGAQVSGEVVFTLYSTYGFPIDLTQIMAEERKLTIDQAGFHALMHQHAQLGEGDKGGAIVKLALDVHAVAELKKQYEATVDAAKYVQAEIEATVKSIVTQEGFVSEAAAGAQIGLVFDATNFYAESGGQIHDTGAAEGAGAAKFAITDVQAYGGYVLHTGTLQEGAVRVGDTLQLKVDYRRRKPVMANHTSTHLINHALRNVLGDRVDQRGSLVAPDRFRFDFSHNKPVAADELVKLDALVSEAIAKELPVFTMEVPLEQALKIKGVRAIFGETYPDPVRVVAVGRAVVDLLAEPDNADFLQYSVEFCGGTHLANTKDAGAFAVLSEDAIAKGVRRIIAVSGQPAADAIQNAKILELELTSTKQAFEAGKLTIDELTQRVNTFLARLSSSTDYPMPAGRKSQLRDLLSGLQNKLRDHSKQQQGSQQKDAERFVAEAIASVTANPAKFLVGTINAGDHSVLVTNSIKSITAKFPELPVLLLSPDAQKKKILIVAHVSKSLVAQGFKANEWASETAKVTGGKGGGKPETGQGAGTDLSKLEEAVSFAKEYATKRLSQ